MFSFRFRNLFRKSKVARQARRQELRKSLRLESLEDRRLLAFTTPVSYPTGSNPAGIAVGDYNADGREDLAVVNNALAGTVGVMLSNADGSFQPGVSHPAGANAFDANAGDLNGDGILDLAVVGATLDILFGHGDGTFADPIEYPVTPSAHSVKVGDFNNDGHLDVGTMNVNSASVYLGNGDGTLGARADFPVAGNNINLVLGDFDRDGNLDMATSNTASVGTVNVLRGHGDGSFSPSSSYYAFSAPVYLASGDFNNDGYDDFAVANSYVATSMSVLLNNGDGTYGTPHTYGIAQTGYEIEVADFNNDGNDDFAVRGGSKYMISHGKGDGTFYPSVSYATPSGRFEAGTHGDFNGDGAVDLAYPSAGGVVVVSNDHADYQNLAGAVTFRVTAPATTTSGSVLPMTIAAIDADGNVATGFRGVVYLSSSDPLASTASGYAFNPLDAGIPYVFTAADAGSHSFTGAIRLVTGGDQTVTVSAPNLQAATVQVNVTGQVTHLSLSAPANVQAGEAFQLTVSALDSQGTVAPGYSSKLHFTSNDILAGLPADYSFTAEDAGSHTFTVTLKTAGNILVNATEVGGSIHGVTTVSVTPLAASSLTLAGGSGAIGVSRPLTIVARDLYGNRATGYSGTVHFTSSDSAAVLPGDTTLVGGLGTANVTFLTVGVQTVTATDLADSAIQGTITSDATPPVPSAFIVSGYPSTVAGTTNGFTVSVIDTIGQPASGFTGTVYFSSSDLQAGLPASYTFTAADAGVHSFAATLKTTGAQSLSVRDTTGSLFGSQGGIQVGAASFSHYALSVPNGTDSKGHKLITAGETISLTVRSVDDFGNTVPNYGGTVHLTSTDPAAALPADYTFSASDSGSHVFAVELRTATVNGEVWSFLVADSSNAATTSSITNFEVVNAAASHFALNLAANITAGEIVSAKVTAVDPFGNRVKNYFGTVHFATSAGSAALPNDYEFTGVDAGMHTFELSLNSSGTQVVSVVDLQDQAVIGNASETVVAAVATHFAVSAPASATGGQPVSVNVTALDPYGNISTGYRGVISVRSSDAAAGLPASITFGTKDGGSVATSVVFNTAGAQTITAVDSLDSTVVGVSGAVDVQLPSVAASFEVTSATTTVAGQGVAVTVRVKTATGAVASGYVGTVTFRSSDVKAGLPANYTFTAADAGVHVFSATLKTAGPQSVSVVELSNMLVAGTGNTISVVAAAASKFLLAAPDSVKSGSGFKLTVTALDAFGNIATSYRGKVNMTSSDSKAGKSSYSFGSRDNGVATLSYTLKTLGTQTLTVMDSIDGTLLASVVVTVTAK